MVAKANVISYILLLSVLISSVIRLRAKHNSEIKRAQEYHKGSLLNFTEATAQNGFPSEEHTVITEDGYLLTIFRLRNIKCNQNKIPVILMHGLVQSADCWIDAGPDAGLAYLLADAGYEVWVGNQRGNYYSRRHLRLNPDTDSKFWQFSVDEIGLYDIPATIDYVLHVTGVHKVNYIGFSQGSGVFFIMCSERPEYCDKVSFMVALAPATRHINSKSVMFRTISEMVCKLERILYSTGIHEIFKINGPIHETLAYLCRFKDAAASICGTVVGLIDSFHPGSMTAKTLQIMISHIPAGTSTHNMARYGQSMRMENFQKFHYGKATNLELYGAVLPPSYNLTAVTAPVLVVYGSNDYIVDPDDVFWLVGKLPEVLDVHEIADPLWNHFDMAYSQHIKKMLFPTIHQYLFQFSKG